MHRTLLPLALLAACQSSSPTAPPEPPLELTKRLDEALAQAVEARGLPGATCAVVLPDGRVLAVATGMADLDHGVPMKPDDRMLAGSTGKTFFAAAALRLEAEGKVDLDDRLARWLGDEPWLEELPNGREVTLRQLLTHTSGVPEHVYDLEFARAVSTQPDRVWGHEELAQLSAGKMPLFAPGESWSYADANYIIAGVALERAAEGELYGYIRRQITGPLGLQDTAPSDHRDIERMAQGHVVLGANLGMPERMLGDDGRLVVSPQFEWAGGGYVTTSLDLARWARALWSGELFGEEALADLLDAVPTPAGPGDAYGIATIVRLTDLGPSYGHDGFFPGYLTTVAWFPEQRIAVALQTNTDDVRAVGGQLFELLLICARAVTES